MSGVASKQWNGDFSQELLSKNDFEAVLATFRCYDHGAKVSKEVQKIDTDQKEYCKCSLCYNLLNSQNIPIKQQWKMVG